MKFRRSILRKVTGKTSHHPHLSAAAWDIRSRLKLLPQATLVVPDSTTALLIKSDLVSLSPSLKIEILHGVECDLIRHRSPNAQTRHERLSFLRSLRDHKTPTLRIISAPSIAQYIASPAALNHRSLSIKPGQQVLRRDLSHSIAELGYVPAEIVEKPGEFAIRGSIVDAFSPGDEFPVRIELLDETVESIRQFHPKNQRRVSDLDEASIFSAREFFFPASAEAKKATRALWRSYLDTWNWDKAEREALLQRFDSQSFFPTIDYWAALFALEHPPNQRLDSAFWNEMLEVAAPLWVLDAESVRRSALVASSEFQRHLRTARVEGEWVPEPLAFIKDGEDIEQTVSKIFSAAESIFSRSPSAAHDGHQKGLESLLQKLSSQRADPHTPPLEPFVKEIRRIHSEGLRVLYAAPHPGQIQRLNFLLGEYGIAFHHHANLEAAQGDSHPFVAIVAMLEEAFFDGPSRTFVLLDEFVFGSKRKRSTQSAARTSTDVFPSEMLMADLKIGDLVSHKKHGIGRYQGLKIIEFGGLSNELIEIEYREGTKLLLPVTRLDQVQKFAVGQGDAPLDKLGGQSWEAKKARVKKELLSLAGELLHLYSKRELARAPELKWNESAVQEFAALFPFEETPDQAKAILDTLKDLKGTRPMDRLLCGDVGYGKTEVALRAAHAAATGGLQVAILCPTTILAAQHEATFKRRLGASGIRVAAISRFKDPVEVKQTLNELALGKVDVVIGTHRLLSRDVRFERLGLLVVDEEQKFGVAHKERVRSLKNNVHVLSMTATPIPRTLHFSISGLKELSVINTPPQNRLSVRTHVARKKPVVIEEAIANEIKRGGQVYYVHNRVQTIEKELAYLRPLLPPGVSIEYVHGQMNEEILEQKMLDFYSGKIQVLLTTSIVESGLDVPNANTLIVDRADAFGLAQLYQLRGRVGRAAERGYAFFLLPEAGQINTDAEERLAVLETYQELGSGFLVATHDMEIRGAGDILGREQSGNVATIGFEAYTDLLQECVAELKGEHLEQELDPEVKLDIDCHIPETYIPEVGLRLGFYRKLAAATNDEELRSVMEDLNDRFGDAPDSVKNLSGIMSIKLLLRQLRVLSLAAGKNGFSVAFDPKTPVQPQKMVAAVSRYPNHFQLSPEGKLLIRRQSDTQDPQKMLRGIEAAITEIQHWCD